MNTTVYKYLIKELNAIQDGQFDTELEMPVGAEILYVEPNNYGCFVWALVDPNAAGEIRHLYSVGTGWGKVIVGSKHIATIKIGFNYWHIFEKPIDFLGA